MLRRREEEQLYFSTKNELKIGNVVYRPSICYKVPPLAKESLNKFAEKGVVVYYDSPVRFVNGAIAKMSEEQSAPGVPSVAKEPQVYKKKGK
jgi:hypothetical protein